MTVPRARALTPVRPGITIKQVLSGQTPLVSGEFVSEAAITDIHSVYKLLVYRENETRPKAKRLKGMTYASFLKIFKFAQLLSLVELVREEPMQYPPPKGHLYSVRVGAAGRTSSAISKRRIFCLSGLGKQDELSWTNLCKAWIEQWPRPQAAPVIAAPPAIEEIPTPPPTITVPEEVPVYKWATRPTTARFKSLLEHLRILDAMGIGRDDVKAEVGRLSLRIGDWYIETEDDLADARAIGAVSMVNRYGNMLALLTEVSEGLADRDLPRAINALEKLSTSSKK